LASDFKREYRKLYLPKSKPSIVTVPQMNYIAVRGKVNPNDEIGEYKNSIELLYGIAFTIEKYYFECVVPLLGCFWWKDGVQNIDFSHKENFNFISVMRLPDFVTKVDFDWVVRKAASEKKADFSKVEIITYNEGVCVQSIHVGPYDDKPKTVALMHEYMVESGYKLDITDKRLHHEIYLSDQRKCEITKLKTVIRHPIKKV